MRNRFLLMILAVCLAIVGWSFAWNGLAATAEEGLDRAFARLNGGSNAVSCDDRKVGGFPFRINVECSAASFVSSAGSSFSSAGLTSSALVYRPTRQITFLKSPAEISLRSGPNLTMTWEDAKIGIQHGVDGPRASSIDVKEFKARSTDPIPNLPDFAVQVKALLLNVAKAQGDGLENDGAIAIKSDTFSLTGLPFKFPKFSVNSSLLFHDVAPVFDDFDSLFDRWIKNGGEGKVNFFDLATDTTHIRASGWTKLDNEGLLSAKLDIDVVGASELSGTIDPEMTQFITVLQGIAFAVEGFGETSTLDDKPAKRIQLTIQRGFAKIGILPIGNIPKLF